MAPTTKSAGTVPAPPPSNGVLTDKTVPPRAPAVNKKKQKRRQKLAARQAELLHDVPSTNPSLAANHTTPGPNGHLPPPPPPPTADLDSHHSSYLNAEDDAQFVYSDDEDGQPRYAYDPSLPNVNGDAGMHAGVDSSSKRKNKKKKKSKNASEVLADAAAPPPTLTSTTSSALSRLPPPPPAPLASNNRALSTTKSKDAIWNTSTHEERGRIKDFWLSLGEEERKSLVKIEKEAVLKKMKEQQKTSCSCTVCGRKRTAIEEELEVLYDAYYDELEQFANHQQSTGGATPQPNWKSAPAQLGAPTDRLPPDRPPALTGRLPRQGLPPILDEEDVLSGEDLDEEGYSDEYDDEEDYSGDDTDDIPPAEATDFFNFGNSLTVKGGILTVADDLLKNDGKKFIDMMEQLAERRMQREEEAQYPPYELHSSVPSHHHGGAGHGSPGEEDYDDEEDEQYESEEEDYEDEDEMDQMTESQRMEEGRRMFQIFAARMFEQRVLTAYREKVARERQEQLIQELEEESRADTQRDAKKAREAEKKKQKKQQQKQAKAEEKARKEEQRLAAEAAAKEAEEKKQEEQRRKREEQRKKKEAERKAQDEERLKKEADRLRRQHEERERQQEQERKAREQKAEEKRRKDDAKKKEREEREAKEREMRERRAAEEKQKREAAEHERDATDGKERRRADEQASTTADALKRSAPPARVALPPGLTTKASFPSPQAKVATPAVPIAPTPGKTQPLSATSVHTSPPFTPQVLSRPKQTTPPRNVSGPHSLASSGPPSRTSSQQHGPALQQPIPPLPAQPHPHQHHIPPPLSPMHAYMPPPGMPASAGPGAGFGNLHSAMNGFPSPSSVIGGATRSMSAAQSPAYAPYGPGMQPQSRNFVPPPPGAPGYGMNAAMNSGTVPGLGRGYTPELAPGFSYPPATSASGNPPPAPYSTTREPMPTHSRQHSLHYEGGHPTGDAPDATGQPIARPAPIKRPSSVKPGDNQQGSEVDELSKTFGSAALLADAEDDLDPTLTGMGTVRRSPNAQQPSGPPSTLSPAFSPSFFETPGQAPFGANSRAGTDGDAWRSPSGPYPTSGLVSPTLAPGWRGHAGTGVVNNAPPSATSTSDSGWGMAGSLGSMRGLPRSTNQPRPVLVRRLVSAACQQISLAGPGATAEDEFVDVHHVLRHANTALKAPHDPDVQLAELLDILDTEGDAHNGGGVFMQRRHGPGVHLIRWGREPEPHGSLGGAFGSGVRANAGVGSSGAAGNASHMGALGGLGGIGSIAGLGGLGHMGSLPGMAGGAGLSSMSGLGSRSAGLGLGELGSAIGAPNAGTPGSGKTGARPFDVNARPF